MSELQLRQRIEELESQNHVLSETLALHTTKTIDLENENDSLRGQLTAISGDLAVVDARKDGAYAERNKVVLALAKAAHYAGYNAGLGTHIDKPGEEPWDPEWRNIVYIDLPTGQVSWHVRLGELAPFRGLPRYTGPYDGHDTEEKYRRLEEFNGFTKPKRLVCGGER